jgi:hypothetical protein
MATVTFSNGEMMLEEFVAKLPSLSFEPITEDIELGCSITTYSSIEDVKCAVEKAFKETTIVVKFNDNAIFKAYFCPTCHSTSPTCDSTCDSTTPHYNPNDEI